MGREEFGAKGTALSTEAGIAKAIKKRVAKVAGGIAVLSERGAVRRLGAKLQRPLLRLAEGPDGEKIVATMERYLLAVRRAELHGDAVANGELDRAGSALKKLLEKQSDLQAVVLHREIYLRRLMYVDKAGFAEALEKATAQARKRLLKAGMPDAAELGAAFIQRTFIDRLRAALSTLKSGASLAREELQLLRAYRKFRAVIGAEWTAGWDSIFRYVREQAPEIASAERRYLNAMEGLENALKRGETKAIRAARQALTDAKQSRSGYFSKIKGLLGEAYVPRWSNWTLQREAFLEKAQGIAERLGPKWKVRHAVGDIRLDGKEAWDEAIFLVREDTGEARLFVAAQFKAEREISAAEQVGRDIAREAGGLAETPKLSFLTIPGEAQPFALLPLPPGETAHRYVMSAAGGTLRESRLKFLEAIGVQVNHMDLDVSLDEFDAMVSAIIAAAAKTVE